MDIFDKDIDQAIADVEIDAADQQTIKLADFLGEWGDVLKAQVLRNMQPIYSQKTEDEWDATARTRLAGLNRQAFSGQITKGILPVARSFFKEDNKAAFLVGEMGVGKTFAGLAVAHLIPKRNKRILIQCPGHLVRKWIREAEKTIPNCTCLNLNGKEMDRLIAEKLAPSKPKGTEIWVIGKERAKLHYQRVPQRITVCGLRCCPECGKPIEAGNFETCTCGARMWMADKSKVRRYAKAEFIKRYLPNKFFDLTILDEVHELKGGGTAQGQAMSCLIARSDKVLALTGSLMGGYVKDLFYLSWRMFPGWMKQSGFEYGGTLKFSERYGVIERTYDSKDLSRDLNLASIGRKISGRHRIKEVPGISPMLLPDLLLERSAFVRLSDISDTLPSYEEIVAPVEMDCSQQSHYDTLENTLVDAAKKAMARGDTRLLGKMLQSLLAYPDGCRNPELIQLENAVGELETIAFAPGIKLDILPKEQQLLNILEAERRQGRKTAVFVEHTGTRDLLPVLSDKLKEAGFSPLVLRSQTVEPEQREDWLRVHMATGQYDCLLSNPNLVKTGLDLLDFPTIIFFQCGYSVFTLRQASRRSWRIGQEHPVKVFFMAYAGTMQEKALSLMARKMETSLAVEGVLSEQGLAALSESENSIVMELARSLTGKQAIQSVADAWKGYRERELMTNLAMDESEEMVETATATITTVVGTAATMTMRYVVRGNVYPRKSGATAYVGQARFEIFNGSITWAGRKVGWYDRLGIGELNNKPIRIFKPGNSSSFVLAEIRTN